MSLGLLVIAAVAAVLLLSGVRSCAKSPASGAPAATTAPLDPPSRVAVKPESQLGEAREALKGLGLTVVDVNGGSAVTAAATDIVLGHEVEEILNDSPSGVASDSALGAASAARPRTKPAARLPARIDVILYNETSSSESTLAGFREGLALGPLLPGRDLELHYHHARGDQAMLGGIVDAALAERPALLVTLSAPALQAALAQTPRGAPPIVFGLVADPVAAGAGRTAEDHLAHVTGISVCGPAPRVVEILKRHYPQFKRVGTLFCPSEENSVAVKNDFTSVAAAQGLTVEAIAVNTPAELAAAALTLASGRVDAIVQISDHLSGAGFGEITRAAQSKNKPLISMNSLMVRHGAAMAIGPDYHDVGLATADRAQRILAGEDPAAIPFGAPSRINFTIHVGNARASGLPLPEAILKEADRVVVD